MIIININFLNIFVAKKSSYKFQELNRSKVYSGTKELIIIYFHDSLPNDFYDILICFVLNFSCAVKIIIDTPEL